MLRWNTKAHHRAHQKRFRHSRISATHKNTQRSWPARTAQLCTSCSSFDHLKRSPCWLASSEYSSTTWKLSWLRRVTFSRSTTRYVNCFYDTSKFYKHFVPQNLQQNDEMIIKTYTESSPPFITAYWPRLQLPAMKLAFGSQVMVQVSVNKDKLVGHRIFYQAN